MLIKLELNFLGREEEIVRTDMYMLRRPRGKHVCDIYEYSPENGWKLIGFDAGLDLFDIFAMRRQESWINNYLSVASPVGNDFRY